MSYPGGKEGAGTFQHIINHIPTHDVYIEPFLGGGAILRLKRPAALNIGVDLNAEVIRTWQHAQSWPAGPRRPPPGLAIAGAPRSAAAPPQMTGAAIVRPARSSRRPGDRTPPDPARGSSSTARPGEGGHPVFRFLKADGIDFLRTYPFAGRELVYCDPPYMPETRTSRRLYEFEMSTDDHRRLLEVIQQLNCRVMISGYSSPLYAAALKGWSATSFRTGTRGGRPAAEWLWFNFPPPTELHDYNYIGREYRERERIRKKIRRWTARLMRLPALERQAILAAIAPTSTAENGVSGR